MVVICPKCKIKLKVNEEKLSPSGTRFKCPKCSTLLLVKKPVQVTERELNLSKVLVAHSDTATLNQITSLLNKHGYQTIIANDGIEAMVKAIKERPFLVIAEVSLPKIFGFEICKRLKLRPEAKGMKFIIVSSPYDKKRYKREPESLYDADDYIEDHRINELLIDAIQALKEKSSESITEKVEKPLREHLVEKPAQKLEPIEKAVEKPLEKPVETEIDENVERAKRLARTILSDIYLYNTQKADMAIKNDSFHQEFAAELKEGMKLYESRIPQEVRSKGDFFKEALRVFIENKKRAV